MSIIRIKQLEKDFSELKELSDRETHNIIGGDGIISSSEIIKIAVQKALIRSDILLNSNVINKSSKNP